MEKGTFMPPRGICGVNLPSLHSQTSSLPTQSQSIDCSLPQPADLCAEQ